MLLYSTGTSRTLAVVSPVMKWAVGETSHHIVKMSNISSVTGLLSVIKWFSSFILKINRNIKPSSDCVDVAKYVTETAVFWVVAPCSLMEIYKRFRGSCCLRQQDDHRLCIRQHGATVQKTAISITHLATCTESDEGLIFRLTVSPDDGGSRHL
jgi:hypothetical protein